MGAEGNARMDSIRLRRTAALLGSAALLASMTVATVAAPAAAGKCAPYVNGTTIPENSGCYYATEALTRTFLLVPVGVTLNGTNADDTVGTVNGTFNGGRGDDTVKSQVFAGGTFNGGPGNDAVNIVAAGGTFNGGSGNDCSGGNGCQRIGCRSSAESNHTVRWLC